MGKRYNLVVIIAIFIPVVLVSMYNKMVTKNMRLNVSSVKKIV